MKTANRVQLCIKLHLYLMIEGYNPQGTDKIKAESSGEHSLKNFEVGELLYTRIS